MHCRRRYSSAAWIPVAPEGGKLALDSPADSNSVRYVAEYQGQWVGLVAWSAGACRLKLREEWIGWNASQKKRRLSLVANNSRFLILAGWHEPNLASRLMKLSLQRLSQDWTDCYGHGVLVAVSPATGPVGIDATGLPASPPASDCSATSTRANSKRRCWNGKTTCWANATRRGTVWLLTARNGSTAKACRLPAPTR